MGAAPEKSGKDGVVRATSMASLILCAASMVLKIVTAIMGRTSIQMIDSARSIVETIAVLIWWMICSRKFSDAIDGRKRERLDVIIRACIVLSGVLIAIFASIRFSKGSTHSGALLPGVLLSLFGMVDNGIIAILYARNKDADPEIITQRRLFTIKSVADASVAMTLIAMMLAPDAAGIGTVEFVSSLVVAGMMIMTGVIRKNTSSGIDR